MSLLLFFVGLAVLVAGAEALVRGASRLAASFGIPSLVIGLTIVACGTSAPELAVSLKAAFSGQPDLVTGNCVGSTLFNVLFILGGCAVLAPLSVERQLVRMDVPVMVGAHLLLLALAWDGMLGRLDGAVLLACFIGYTAFTVRKSLRTPSREGEAHPGGSPWGHAAWTCAGLALCVLGARWMVEGAVGLARSWGVSELVIGLTVVAAGTSAPEAATSVVAALRGQRDIAIGNVVGSNIFNILGIVGLATLLAPSGVAVAPAVNRFDLPAAIAVCAACLPVFFTGRRIDRWEGALFLGYYAAYVGYLLLAARSHDALPAFSAAMLWFVLPLSAAALAVLAGREARKA